MLKAKTELESYLKKEFLKIVADNEKHRAICDYSKAVYEIPRSITSDYITLRTPLTEATEFILFCLLDALEKVTDKSRSKIDEFFVEKEVATYSKTKLEVDKIKFPLRFKMIQIADDQWIGSIDFKMLMKLRAAQLINYNENAQRTMQKIIRGDTEIYKIAINEDAVRTIAELYKNNVYIPTPFTLNIPEEAYENDFYYDESNCELVIRSLEHFDILDGYHRYLASCRVCDENSKLNYSMELRIVSFAEEKAKQFIYQEDQKTKMKKMDSDSYNMNDDANATVSKINTNPSCNLKGLIANNKGIINFSQLAELVKILYFSDVKSKENGRKIMISVAKDLTESFNLLTEYDIKYLTKPYKHRDLTIIMVCFAHYSDKDKSDMCETIEKVFIESQKLGTTNFSNKSFRKKFMKDIESILMEVS